MKKIIIIILVLNILLYSCDFNYKKDVLFYNGYYSIGESVLDQVGAEPMSMIQNYILMDGYIKAEIEDDELCGVVIKMQRYHNKELPKGYPTQREDESTEAFELRCEAFEIERLKHLLLEEGIYILNDYDNCLDFDFSFAIATTMEKLLDVFGYYEGKTIGGWSCLVALAFRPDLSEIAAEYGYYDAESICWDNWFYTSDNELKNKLLEEGFKISFEMFVTSPQSSENLKK